jgi:acyl-CoA reductase-like NAD-dependent aldehyde dehydrogenase
MAVAELQALNYIGGEWRRSRSSESIDVFNPANGELLARAPFGGQ